MGDWVNPADTHDYVLPEHRPLAVPPGTAEDVAKAAQEENTKRAAARVVFRLRVLTDSEYAAVQDSYRVHVGTRGADDAGVSFRAGTMNLLLLRYGLRGWDGPGAPPFKADADGRPTSDTLSRLPSRWRQDLANTIDHLCAFGPDAVKA